MKLNFDDLLQNTDKNSSQIQGILNYINKNYTEIYN